MGQICCYEKQLTINQAGDGVKQKENILDKENSVDFIKLLGNEIQFDLKMTEQVLEKASFKSSKNQLLKNQKLRSFDQKLNFWFDLTPLENSSYFQHNNYVEMEYPYTPELGVLFYLNLQEEVCKKIDDSIDIFEVKNYCINEQYAIQIIFTKSKKILMIQPRYFLAVKVLKRNGKNDFSEYHKSIQLTELNKDYSVQQFIKQFEEDMGTLKLQAIQYEKKENGYIFKYQNQIDILSSVGKRLIQGTLKSKMKNYHDNMLLRQTEFLLLAKKSDLIWFSHDQSVINKIFEDNLQILKKLKIKAENLNKEAQVEFQNLIDNKQENQLQQINGKKDQIQDLNALNQALDSAKSNYDSQNQKIQMQQDSELDVFNKALDQSKNNDQKKKTKSVEKEIKENKDYQTKQALEDQNKLDQLSNQNYLKPVEETKDLNKNLQEQENDKQKIIDDKQEIQNNDKNNQNIDGADEADDEDAEKDENDDYKQLDEKIENIQKDDQDVQSQTQAIDLQKKKNLQNIDQQNVDMKKKNSQQEIIEIEQQEQAQDENKKKEDNPKQK